MDNLRLPLTIAFLAIGFMLWSAWQEDYHSPVTPTAVSEQQAGSNPLNDALDNTLDDDLDDTLELPEVANSNPAQPAFNQQTQTAATATGQKILVETDELRVTINTAGGTIERVFLKNFRDGPEKDKQYRLLNKGPDLFYITQSGLLTRDAPAPSHTAIFTSAQPSYKLAEGADTLAVPLTWNQEGVIVTKTFTFTRGSFEIELEQAISNNRAEPWTGSQYVWLQRNAAAEENAAPFMQTYLGASWYVAEDPGKYRYGKLKFNDLRERYEDYREAQSLGREAETPKFKSTTEGGWISMVQHYFIGAIIPPENETNTFYAVARDRGQYRAGYQSAAVTIPAGGSESISTTVFLGPKLQDILPDVAPGLARTVDYGWLTIISDPLFWLLSWFNKILGNWGLAIILLTFVVKALFYKLSEAQYRSMARMKKFAPRIKTLRERHADDKEKLQRAMMELYKKEKFNPLGGCWPLLVQIPVFIALYWVLLESVELRDAPFFLWIDDLSQPDKYFVLPILMGAGMIAQQKMSSSSMAMDPLQQKIMMAMPIAFTVFFAFFPSGLVLYWLVNTVLSITQQWYINRKIEREGKN